MTYAGCKASYFILNALPTTKKEFIAAKKEGNKTENSKSYFSKINYHLNLSLSKAFLKPPAIILFDTYL